MQKARLENKWTSPKEESSDLGDTQFGKFSNSAGTTHQGVLLVFVFVFPRRLTT